MDTPKHLQSTVSMLSRAFPFEMNSNEYESVIRILYNYMSDRNLADTMHIVTGKESVSVLNDIYQIHTVDLNPEYEKVKSKLINNGFDIWSKEE